MHVACQWVANLGQDGGLAKEVSVGSYPSAGCDTCMVLCKTLVMRDKLCTKDIEKDIEMLTVSLRLHYLLREFPQILVSVVSIHPKTNVNLAMEYIEKSLMKYQQFFYHG